MPQALGWKRGLGSCPTLLSSIRKLGFVPKGKDEPPISLRRLVKEGLGLDPSSAQPHGRRRSHVVLASVTILGLVGPLFFYFPRALFPY